MILILSNSTDETTDLVCNYLYCFKRAFVRLNLDNDFVEGIVYKLSNLNSDLKLTLSTGKTIYYEKVNFIWYRRGEFNLYNVKLSSKLKKSILNSLEVEKKIIIEYLYMLNVQKKHIGDIRIEINNNKIIQLTVAKNNGLNIPETLVTTKGSEIREFSKNFTSIITKPLSNNIYLKKNNIYIGNGGVKRITSDELICLNEYLPPVLVQNEIKKKFELRIFFLFEKYYPMAIFSQNKPETEVDFRKYETFNYSRSVPYKLDNKTKNKLDKIVHILKMNTGSIDLLVSADDQIYFLEINHIGQFGWLSYNCNYHIEKEIAIYLSKNSLVYDE